MTTHSELFSQSVLSYIDSSIKSYNAKEKFYDYLDELEKNDNLLLVQYQQFKKHFSKYDDWVSDRFQSSMFDSTIADNMKDDLTSLFKGIKQSDYISNPDKTLMYAYVMKHFGFGHDSINMFPNPKEILEKKLGARFNDWAEVWNKENIDISLSQAIKEGIEKYDSHRYSDEVLRCFVEATKTDNYIEGFSECQYQLHVSGEDTSEF
jgi:hypothetical protein